MADVDRLALTKARAAKFGVIDGGGGSDDTPGMEARVTSLEIAVRELKVGIDALRHNQTIFLTAIIFILTLSLGVIYFFSSTTLGELRAMNQRIDRYLERPTPSIPAPQIIVVPAPAPAPPK